MSFIELTPPHITLITAGLEFMQMSCGEREHAREVLKLKPSGYLTKPATQEQIMQEIRELRYPVRYNDVGDDNRSVKADYAY